MTWEKGADLLGVRAQVREALSRKVSRERVGAELEGMFQGAPARRSCWLIHGCSSFHYTFSSL